jgi:Fe-S cluster assembly protein SufD
MTALPTRRDEAFRYTDTEALARVWPVAVETIVVPADGNHHLQIINTASEDAVFTRHIHLTLGRIELNAVLHDGADLAINAVQIGGGKQTVELITTVTHAEPNAMSNQQVRTVLAGQATGTYLGKVAVARDAQHTDSVQSVKAMLLDRTATANAKPELEIYADDVKCAHGCAVGELDAMGLFYFESRGLAPADAKKLMLQAFVAGVFDGAEGEEALTAAALAKLGELV